MELEDEPDLASAVRSEIADLSQIVARYRHRAGRGRIDGCQQVQER